MCTLILDATSRAEEKSINTLLPSSNPTNIKDIIFLHFQFHRGGVTSAEIRAAYQEHLETLCKAELGSSDDCGLLNGKRMLETISLRPGFIKPLIECIYNFGGI